MSRFVVTAFCSRPGCPVTEFVDVRSTLTYRPFEGGEIASITHLQCPCCKGMGRVVESREVA